MSTGHAWLEGLLIILGFFLLCMFWNPATTYAFLSHVPFLQVVYGWARQLLHFLGR